MILTLFEELELYYPHIAKRVVKQQKLNFDELMVCLDDGLRFLYTRIGNRIRQLPNDPSCMTEQEYREEFGARLSEKMLLRGVRRRELSEKTGIPEPTLSRYITGTRTPTSFAVDKIARALNCSTEEFRYLDFDERKEN